MKKQMLLLLLLIAVVMTGCGGQNADTTTQSTASGEPGGLTKEELDRAVVIVDQSYIDVDTFSIYYQMQMDAYSTMYGADVGEQEMNGIKFSEILKQNMAEDFANDLAIVNYIRSQGHVVTASEVEAEFASFVEQSKTSGAYENLKNKFGVTDEFAKKEIERSLYVSKFEQMLREKVEADSAALDEIYKNRIVQVKARHILVKTEEEAQKVIEEIQAGLAFSDAAAQYSLDAANAQNGGDLGYFSRGVMVPEFEQMAFDLPVGEISSPVRSDFGYHIIQVEDARTIDQMKSEGVAELEVEKQENAVVNERINSEYFKMVEELITKSDVVIHIERVK